MQSILNLSLAPELDFHFSQKEFFILKSREMKYKSTRGGVTGVSFEETLFQGYAPDGGLFVPESIPTFPQELLMKWKESNSPPKYPEVVYEIVKLFVTEEELPRDILKECIAQAYSSFRFDTENVVEFQDCGDYKVVELFHGRTKSFKDYALSLVGRLMSYYLQKHGTHATILVGTSGDTGSAAIEAVRGLQGIDIIVLYPQGKVTQFQELQMITVGDDNVHVFEVEGTSDDLDEPIKKCFPSEDGGLTSINSINWARIMIQVAHYVYLSVLEGFQEIDVFVPTGGCGNISAGLLASLLGFPVNLFAAQNVNSNVAEMINTGELFMGGKVEETFANAMDIRYPYNVERLLYFVTDSTEAVAKIMKETEMGKVKIPKEILEKLRARVKGALMVDQERTLETIQECWNKNGYLICPHTATAVTYFSQRQKEIGSSSSSSSTKSYVIATASPEKFPDAIKAAQLHSPDDSDFTAYFGARNKTGKGMLEELMTLKIKQPKKMRKGEDWYALLLEEIRLTKSKQA